MKSHLDNDDLREIRGNVDWRELFQALEIRRDERKSRTDDWWGHSPFSPDERTPSFHMNDSGWYCHSTGQGGGPVELVQRLQGCNCYEAGRWLVEHGVSHLQALTRRMARNSTTSKAEPEEYVSTRTEQRPEVKENPTLRQDLRPHLSSDHFTFRERGIPPEALAELGAGYYAGSPRSRSPLKGRLVFQIRGVRESDTGTLEAAVLSHIGRATTEEQEREGGKWHFYAGFHASLELYNQDMVVLDAAAVHQAHETGHVLIVEGCFDVAKLWSAGIRNVVAAFGAHLSGEQVARLQWISERSGTNRVLVLFDRDQDGSEPNRQGAQRAVELVRSAGLEADSFDWGMQFRDRRRGTVGIAKTITDPCELTIEQVRWLRDKGIL